MAIVDGQVPESRMGRLEELVMTIVDGIVLKRVLLANRNQREIDVENLPARLHGGILDMYRSRELGSGGGSV